MSCSCCGYAQRVAHFAIIFEGPSTRELEKRNKNLDNNHDNKFALPNIRTKVFNAVGQLKNNKVNVNVSVSAKVLKTSLPVIIFFIEFIFLLLSRGWFLKCLKDAKVYLLHNLGDLLKIIPYRLNSVLPAISEVFDKIMDECL